MNKNKKIEKSIKDQNRCSIDHVKVDDSFRDLWNCLTAYEEYMDKKMQDRRKNGIHS